jgi:hypothetical protein
MNKNDFEVNTILSDNNLRGIQGDIYYTKDLNFLNSISKVSFEKGNTIIDFHSILPNTVIILKLSTGENIRKAINRLNKNIDYIFNRGIQYVDYFDACDINNLLFKTENEEKDNTFNKRGTFDLNLMSSSQTGKYDKNLSNKMNKFVYAGLNQLVETLNKFKKIYNDSYDINNNPLYNSIVMGDWLIDYIMYRLSEIKSFNPLFNFISENIINDYKMLYPHIKPIMFDKIVTSIYYIAVKTSLNKIPSYLFNFGSFSKKLSLARYEFIGHIIGSTFEFNLGQKQINISQNLLNISISSGLPAHDISFYRMYTRDTLISFKSLFLIPRLFSEGKTILKIIGATFRHGLIPNLFDRGSKPRYNARDTPWLYIKSIKDYLEYTNDMNFLKEEIELVYLSDKNMNEHFKLKANY